MRRKNKRFPAVVPVAGRKSLQPEFRRPEVIRALMRPRRLDRFLKKLIKETAMDEFSEADLEGIFEMTRQEAIADLDAQMVKLEAYDREILADSRVEQALLETYASEIRDELEHLKNGLSILDRNTDEWAFPEEPVEKGGDPK